MSSCADCDGKCECNGIVCDIGDCEELVRMVCDNCELHVCYEHQDKCKCGKIMEWDDYCDDIADKENGYKFDDKGVKCIWSEENGWEVAQDFCDDCGCPYELDDDCGMDFPLCECE